ncbi:MAG: ABC transporter ATP-binding protein [Dehalococcoidales bacterium]|nr:ABC transporter ATP-binding protein [Dehalococcoidales bacterium]
MYPTGIPHWVGQLHSAFDEDEEEMLGRAYDWRVIKRLPKYLIPVKSWIALGAAGMIIRSIASLALPYLIAVATDRYIQTGNLSGLNVVAIFFAATTILVWAGQYLETSYLSYAGDAILLTMRTQMFDHLQQLSLSFFDHNKVGKIMSRVQNDVQQLQELITADSLNIIISFLTLIGIAIVMMVMNTRLALLTLTVVPVLGLMILVWNNYARRAFVRVRRAIAAVNAQLQENISGVRAVQSLSRERLNFEQFSTINREHLSANVDATKLIAVMMPIGEIMAAVASGLVIVFGGYQVQAGQMGIGVLLGFLLYVQRFFNPVLELIMEYTELQRAMVAGARIFELLDVTPEITDSPEAIEIPAVKGKIEFKQVSFGYLPDIEVLHDLDLSIKPGETVAIVGRTGAGKSSLVSLLARFYEISKGMITVDDYDVRSVTQQSLRRQMGMVLQDPFLFSGSVEDNIKYGNPMASQEEVIEAARIAGAHEFIMHLEHGYDALVGERGSNLSAGQRQFICLTRAILANPPILVLDEATSNVDTNAERLMQKSLHHLMQGRTCLVIAHRLSTVTNADRIIVLEKGRIAETGNHHELLAKQGLYYQMLEALNRPDAE